MISAEEFSKAGSKYIGRSYDDMDCQEFVERCAEDCGLHLDLAGSNAWYRKMDWTGSPEECKAKFGVVPKGALIYIHAFDGGEEKRGYHDGKGNASHIGIKTGTGEGAIHSSQTRGCVAESVFQDKTIRNGGWNKVGLSVLFDYGEKINKILRGGSAPDEDQGGDEMPMQQTATTWAISGSTVNMRSKPNQSANLVERIPIGETVIILEQKPEWSKCSWGRFRGWIMNQFLITAEDDPDDQDEGDESEPAEEVKIELFISAENASAVLEFLESVKDEIINQIGRG